MPSSIKSVERKWLPTARESEYLDRGVDAGVRGRERRYEGPRQSVRSQSRGDETLGGVR